MAPQKATCHPIFRRPSFSLPLRKTVHREMTPVRARPVVWDKARQEETSDVCRSPIWSLSVTPKNGCGEVEKLGSIGLTNDRLGAACPSKRIRAMTSACERGSRGNLQLSGWSRIPQNRLRPSNRPQLALALRWVLPRALDLLLCPTNPSSPKRLSRRNAALRETQYINLTSPCPMQNRGSVAGHFRTQKARFTY